MNEDAWPFCFRAGLAPRLRHGVVYRVDYPLLRVRRCFSQSPAPSQRAARAFQASRAVPLPVALSLLACGAAADWIWANVETSPSPARARHPNEKRKGNGAKNNQRQSECDANLEPLKK